jgi:two-component sensor histidine kinase
MGAGRDLNAKHKDGSEFPVEIGLTPVARNGRRGVLATVIDISERKRAQDRQRLLVSELQHRTANLFNVIQAIAARTLAENQTLLEARVDFNGRLQALARAYAMLTESQWEGAPFDRILARELAPFSKRIAVAGCNILLTPAAAQHFALIVHELATNAAKHGALSVPDGHVAIDGAIERQDGAAVFLFRWKESGGPPVSRPARKGLGSVILLESGQQFGQMASMDPAPDGLGYVLRVSLASIEAKPAEPSAAPLRVSGGGGAS